MQLLRSFDDACGFSEIIDAATLGKRFGMTKVVMNAVSGFAFFALVLLVLTLLCTLSAYRMSVQRLVVPVAASSG